MPMHCFIIVTLLYMQHVCLPTYPHVNIKFLEHSSSSGIEYVHSKSTMVSDTQMAVPSNSAIFTIFFWLLVC